MSDHLYEKALSAISELFSDRSVSRAETREALENLVVEIEIMIDTLSGDEGES